MSKQSKNQNQREPISKRLRFEVFKRDAFTCQYCGRKAPDVLLEVDHVEPVSKGGKTNILNLITSCCDCNRGKSNIKLSDNSAFEKQKKTLSELSEKQEQLEMLLKWRSGLLNIEKKEINTIISEWERLSSYSLSEYGISEIKKVLKNYGLIAVLDAMEIATRYLEYKDNKVTKESVENALNKVKGICYIKSLPEKEREEYRIIGELKYQMKQKYYKYNEKWAPIYIKRFIKAGYDTQALSELIDGSRSYDEWEDKIIRHIRGFQQKPIPSI